MSKKYNKKRGQMTRRQSVYDDPRVTAYMLGELSAAESAEMFDSDMAVYLNAMKRKNSPAHLKVIEDNIALMKKWAKEGK